MVSATNAVASSKSVGTTPKCDLFLTKYSCTALVNSSASAELLANLTTPSRKDCSHTLFFLIISGEVKVVKLTVPIMFCSILGLFW